MAGRNILFVHNNFPGQFPHIAEALRQRGDKLAAIGSETARNIPGIDVRRWKYTRSTTPNLYPPAVRPEADLMRAEAAAHVAQSFIKDGFKPDLIIGHPGWGETIHLPSLFPGVPIILLGEYFYRSINSDVDFDPEFGVPDFADRMRINALNAGQGLAYMMADRIVCPTPFQASTFPAILQPKIVTLHEGIGASLIRRRPAIKLQLPNGHMLDASRPVITYVSRTLEPVRGFHILMRALPAVLDARRDAEVVVMGTIDRNGYTARPRSGGTWHQKMLDELGDRLDRERVHFLGPVTHDAMLGAMSIGAAHVYYTYPFVLSWSLLEAMACECLIVASDTAPIHDALKDGETALLRPFFDADALSETLLMAIEKQDELQHLRTNAREVVVSQYDRDGIGLPGWLALIDDVLS